MKSYIKRKDRIVLTAIEIIDELGFQGLSIKEISKRQNFSEGSLYKHFTSKNAIIIEVLRYCTKFDADIEQSVIFKSKSSVKDGLIFYFLSFAENYENYPAMTAIFNLNEVFRDQSIIGEVKNIRERHSKFFNQMVMTGIEKGEFKPETDGAMFSDLVWGTFHYIILRWRCEKYGFKLKECVESRLNRILEIFEIQ